MGVSMAERFTRQSVSLPPLMLADLKAEALERDLSLSQLVREKIRNGSIRDTQGNLDLRRDGGSNDHGH